MVAKKCKPCELYRRMRDVYEEASLRRGLPLELKNNLWSGKDNPWS